MLRAPSYTIGSPKQRNINQELRQYVHGMANGPIVSSTILSGAPDGPMSQAWSDCASVTREVEMDACSHGCGYESWWCINRS